MKTAAPLQTAVDPAPPMSDGAGPSPGRRPGPAVWEADFRLRLKRDEPGFTLDLAFDTAARRLVLCGPSGAGKSLSLRVLAGLLPADEGRLAFEGGELFDTGRGLHQAPQQRGLSLVFQDYALFPHLSVRQNLAFGHHRGWANPPRGSGDPVIESLLQRFDLEGLAQRRPAQLSGGQRQRVALARAVAARPRALLLDEPFAALDAALRRRLHAELDALLAEMHIPLVLVTHDAEEVERFGDAVLTLEDGRVTSLRER